MNIYEHNVKIYNRLNLILLSRICDSILEIPCCGWNKSYTDTKTELKREREREHCFWRRILSWQKTPEDARRRKLPLEGKDTWHSIHLSFPPKNWCWDNVVCGRIVESRLVFRVLRGNMPLSTAHFCSLSRFLSILALTQLCLMSVSDQVSILYILQKY